MFFARVLLNPTRRQTSRFLASPQALHAVVMGSCDHGSGLGDGRVLWRVDRPERHRIELYVVSPVEPDFTGLLQQAGWPLERTWDCTDYDPFLGRLATGQRWRFRLTANPVTSLPREGGRGTVVPHISPRHQQEWLLRRQEGWGFVVPPHPGTGDPALLLQERGVDSFTRTDPSAGRPGARGRVTLTRATYTGVLQVADPDRLRRALVGGMGRAKAYGCGLMTLAPVG